MLKRHMGFVNIYYPLLPDTWMLYTLSVLASCSTLNNRNILSSKMQSTQVYCG